jgi:hypothetical protein
MGVHTGLLLPHNQIVLTELLDRFVEYVAEIVAIMDPAAFSTHGLTDKFRQFLTHIKPVKIS